jgi:hypothetical protein
MSLRPSFPSSTAWPGLPEQLSAQLAQQLNCTETAYAAARNEQTFRRLNLVRIRHKGSIPSAHTAETCQNDILKGKSSSKDLYGYKAIPKLSSKRDIYTAVKVYITFLKGLYAHPERTLGRQIRTPGSPGRHIRTPRVHSGASNTHTQSALWGVNKNTITIIYHPQCIPT